MLEDEPLTELSNIKQPIATRAAHEGIPIAAIGRILSEPFDAVAAHLHRAVSSGDITAIPKADWPPATLWSERLPSVPRTITNEEIEFRLKKLMKLTKLEVAFLGVLLRNECVEKDKLHAVVEDQRSRRATRANNQDITDPKIVDVMICKLRKKLVLFDGNFVLKTSWGYGYYFDPEVKKLILGRIS